MSQKIYVGNLSFSTNEDALQQLFSTYGDVVDVKVIKDRDTGRSKGFAFVEMGSSDAINQAVEELDGKEFEGRSLKVSKARPQERSGGGNGPRRGGFGGGDRGRGGFGGGRH